MFRTLFDRFSSGEPEPLLHGKDPTPPGRTRRHFPSLYPKSMHILFSAENPRREGTIAHGRYHQYSEAVTIEEALERGATYKEIDHAFGCGACVEIVDDV